MTTERWTDESLDRFASTITTVIAANNEAIAASNERLTRTEHLLDSAARSIQAMLYSKVLPTCWHLSSKR